MAVQLTEEERKFDRQIRLWGPHGQRALRTAKVLMLGSGATATETLKNIVLPNMGAFTVVDDAKVTETDLGNNFFVDTDQVGKARAAVITEFLAEMNPAVKGTPVIQNPSAFIKAQLPTFSGFNLIIASANQVSEADIHTVAAFAYGKQIPMLIVRAYGFVGYCRTLVPEQRIVESHPSNDRTDIYVHPDQIKHWPELKKYCESFDLKSMDDYHHLLTPYIVILHQQMQIWLQEHKGKVPSDSAEKDAFKKQINTKARRSPTQILTETNIDEAVQNAHRAYNLPELDSSVERVLADPKGDKKNITKDSPNFWVLVAALREWQANEGHGLLPVSANIPDMHSLSKFYIQLKEIFANRAAQDQKQIGAHAQKILQSVGRADSISEEELDRFVRNVRGLYVVRTRPLSDEKDAKTFPTEDVNDMLSDPWKMSMSADELELNTLKGPGNLHWYFALRCVDRFFAKNNRYPGGNPDASDEENLADLAELREIAAAFTSEFKLDAAVEDQCLVEMVRAGAQEVHNIAAFVAGVAAQDAVKLVVQQFVPNNSALIYNGVHGSVSMFKI